MRKIILLSVFIFIGFTFTSHSQNAEGKKILDHWSLNINAGVPMLWGDIESTFSDEFKLGSGFGVYIAKRFGTAFELRGQLVKGALNGSKPSANRYFEAEFYKYDVNATLSITRLIYGDDPCKRINVYGIVGIGLIQYKSLLKRIGDNKILGNAAYKSVVGGSGEEWETEAYIPIGLGISFKLDKRFEINGENTWSVVNSDRVDANVGKFKYDIISYTSVGITYKFNFHKNPGIFVECGVNSSRTGRGSLGDGAYYGDGASKAELDSIKAKLKDLEDGQNKQDNKINEIDDRVKVIENTPKVTTTPDGKINVDALKENLYNSLLDTLKNSIPAPAANPVNVPSNQNQGSPNIIGMSYLLYSVYFDVDKYNIKDIEMIKVASVAENMNSDKNLKIKIVGNADQTGPESYNENLSKNRAEAVLNTLVYKYGIDKNRLSIEFKGEKEPYSNDNLSINRRVDFIKQ